MVAKPQDLKPVARSRYSGGVLGDLLARFHRDGDAAAMETIVARTRGRLLVIARRIGAPQDAEDSVQAAYHALLRREGPPDTVEAWLTTAVVRIAYRRKALARREIRLAGTLARDGDPLAEAARRAIWRGTTPARSSSGASARWAGPTPRPPRWPRARSSTARAARS